MQPSFTRISALVQVLRSSVVPGANKATTKKGGAGGKGTWGKPGDEYGMMSLDRKDPNYDSGGEDGYILEATE
jgi:hypothetical protein